MRAFESTHKRTQSISHSQSHTSEGKSTKKKKRGGYVCDHRLYTVIGLEQCSNQSMRLLRDASPLSFDVRCAQPHFIARRSSVCELYTAHACASHARCLALHAGVCVLGPFTPISRRIECVVGLVRTAATALNARRTRLNVVRLSAQHMRR